MQFLGPCAGRPRFFEQCRERDYLPLVDHCVRIMDRRDDSARPTLQNEGFELFSWPTSVTDVLTPDGYGTHASEVEALIVECTGASAAAVLGSGVVRRSERSSRYQQDGTTVPGRFVHCDFAADSDGQWIRQQLAPEQAVDFPAGRIAIYNVWRSLSPPPQDAPLALCDRRSVGAGERVVADQVIDRPGVPERRIEIELLRYAESQRWCYYSNMTRDEVIVFVAFDSVSGGGVPHAAFDDPTCSELTAARESIDERVVAVFA